MDKGLYAKYVVTKDGQPVEDCFVLRPDRDPAARVALRAYADATENRSLRDDLLFWLLHRLSHHDEVPEVRPIESGPVMKRERHG